MQKINLREIDPDVYKTDNLMEGAEAVLAVIRTAEPTETAYERWKYCLKTTVHTFGADVNLTIFIS